jgi:hypothetical protein
MCWLTSFAAVLTCGCLPGAAQFAVATVTTGNRELWQLAVVFFGVEDIIGGRSGHPAGLIFSYRVWGR